MRPLQNDCDWLKQIASGAEISRLIKMLTSDNVKDMARKLGKSSHSHPLLFADKVLNQLERLVFGYNA